MNMEKKSDKKAGPSTKRKATTKSQVPVSRKVSSKRKEKLYTVLLSGIENAPGVKYKVSVVDAKPGQPIAPHSDLGEMKVILKTKSKKAFGDTVIINSKEYGVIKEMYIEKGDTVKKGQSFALVEVFDKDEFPQRSDDYVTAMDSCTDLALVEYPNIFESEYPELLRRAAKLMTAFYLGWCDPFVQPRPKTSAITDYDISCEAETTDPEPYETWTVSRSMFFGGGKTRGLQIWFEDEILMFGGLYEQYCNARYERKSSKDPFRHSNVLRWVFEMERAISEESYFGDRRVQELYRIIEIEKGIEYRTKD